MIDGYQLNHDQVKILNINTGSITLGPDTYSQLNGDSETPWDARSDAYVIRGKGNSVNNITVSSPQVKTTIYLMDLEWNGTITYSQDTELELVICGEVVNHSNFITSAQKEKLTIKGLTADGNSVRTDGYIFNSCTLNSLVFENISIEARELGDLTGEYKSYYVYCNNVLIDHSKVTNMVLRRSTSIEEPGIIIKNNSEMKNLHTIEDGSNFTNTIQVSDSRVENVGNYICISYQCSIKGDFVGTPVDYEAHDLFLKILRLRDHPNEYVSVSIDGGESVKLLTDLNGSIFPYINAGSSAVTVTTADGTNYSTTFDPITADDKTVIILTPGGGEGEGEGGGGTVDTDAPKITDTSLRDLYLNVGDALSLTLTAASQTKPAALSYQWYKGTTALDGETSRTLNLKKVKASDAGSYHCLVTDDLLGTTTESYATVISVK